MLLQDFFFFGLRLQEKVYLLLIRVIRNAYIFYFICWTPCLLLIREAWIERDYALFITHSKRFEICFWLGGILPFYTFLVYFLMVRSWRYGPMKMITVYDFLLKITCLVVIHTNKFISQYMFNNRNTFGSVCLCRVEITWNTSKLSHFSSLWSLPNFMSLVIT